MSNRETLKLTLLGGFQARAASGDILNFPTKKAQALVAYLAMRLGQLHAREKLATLLWGDTVEDRARNSLRQTVFALRKLFAGAGLDSLVVEGEALGLRASGVEVDVAQFERLAAERSLETLEQAAARYTGDLLEGLTLREAPFEEWVTAERERLREVALEAFVRLLRLQSDAGRGEAAIQTAVRLLALDPLQEPVHRALMRLYAQHGRRGAALRQYQVCADILRRELGVAVEPETEQLHEEILRSRAARGVPPRDGPKPHVPAILIVEDDPATRAILERYLERAGYEVVAADDGTEALLQLGQRRFDLVLSDIHMPMLDGLKLLEIMSDKGIDTPAVFLTAQAGDELEVRGLKLGAADYIRKPVQKEVLLLRVKNVLNRSLP